jgi:hypothetical protein
MNLFPLMKYWNQPESFIKRNFTSCADAMNQILQMYFQDKKTAQKIAKLYKLDTYTVEMCILSSQVHTDKIITEPIVKSWKHPKSKISQRFETIEQAAQTLIEKYKQGHAVSSLTREYGTGASAIEMLIELNGIPRRKNRTRNLHKSNFREDWDKSFSEPSPAALYWAGFLMADGYISKPRSLKAQHVIGCGLSHIDRTHLENLAQFVGRGDVTTRPRQGKAEPTCRWNIVSDQIAEDLKRWGITPGKGNKDDTKPTNEAMMSVDFWRGVLDGDGTITPSYRTPRISLVGRQGICEAFVEFVRQKIKIQFKAKNKKIEAKQDKNSTAYRVYLLNNNAVNLAELLYQSAPPLLRLERKYLLAKRMLEQGVSTSVLFDELSSTPNAAAQASSHTSTRDRKSIVKPGWDKIDGIWVFVGVGEKSSEE